MLNPRLVAVCTLLIANTAVAADLQYVTPAQADPHALVVDTRPEQRCMHHSIRGAHCLPAADLIGPRGGLPSFPDLLWAFGTAGLSGEETVLVAGARAGNRDFVAGLLYLSGQARVQILTMPIAHALKEGRFPAGPGRGRGMLRDPIYTAQMRDRLIDLPGDLREALSGSAAPAVIDGRRAGDFHARAHDGGLMNHIPQAINQPLVALYRHPETVGVNSGGDDGVVVYGYGPMDSIALFTRLRAGGVPGVRVLIGGWRAWIAAARSRAAADGNAAGTAYRGLVSAAGVRTAGVIALIVAALLLLMGMWTKRGKRWM
ncbi:MAG: rhodanese-like domain-containing protein [Gammaproteobacteria bacterium]